jgi:Crossover junction endodeoxyribonuclease RuvC
MLFLGVDPGVRLSAFALVNDQCKLIRVGVVKTSDPDEPFRGMARAFAAAIESFPDLHSAAVEGQEVYAGGVRESIVQLAQTAGAIGALLALTIDTVLLPEPKRWKGQVPKEINQARSLSRVGIQHVVGSSYCYPAGCAASAQVGGLAQLNRGDWKHVGDAVGLALWARDVEAGRKGR